MMILLLLAAAGMAAGALSGGFANGVEGSILGACTGLVVGVGLWIFLATIERIRRERRLDSYFSHSSSDGDLP